MTDVEKELAKTLRGDPVVRRKNYWIGPRSDSKLNISIPTGLYNVLKSVAEDYGHTMTWVICHYLRYLKQFKKDRRKILYDGAPKKKVDLVGPGYCEFCGRYDA